MTSASSSATLSIRTLTTPCSGLTPSARPIDGRRRSASIRITLLPAAASEVARLIAVVVLPSDGEEPVTRIAVELALGAAPRRRPASRAASGRPRRRRGRGRAGSSGVVCRAAALASGSAPGSAAGRGGAAAPRGAGAGRATWSAKAAAMPRIRPASRPATMLSFLRGRCGPGRQRRLGLDLESSGRSASSSACSWATAACSSEVVGVLVAAAPRGPGGSGRRSRAARRCAPRSTPGRRTCWRAPGPPRA